MERSPSNLVRIDVDIKSWLECPPTVEQVRPSCCPRCKAASREPGKPIGLHGHGLRERQLRGPLEPYGPPRLVILWLRRFRCRHCGATLTVGPCGLLARRLFSGAAIALALALWAVTGHAAPAVRTAVSPWRVVGYSSARTWLTLRRWVADAREFFPVVRPWPDSWPSRKAAERIAWTVGALAPADTPMPARAFFGAAHAR